MAKPAQALLRASASVRRYTGNYAAHSHGFAQVLVGLSGRLELEVEGRGAVIDASSGLIIPAGARHAFHTDRDARMWVVDAPDQPGLAQWRPFSAPQAWQRALNIGRAGDSVAAQALLAALRQAPHVQVRRRLDLARLLPALDAALHESWTTQRMAALFSLSPQRFHARLLALTGETPQALLRRLRLDRATALLRAGVSLEAAALQVGYGTPSALAFALRRERGVGARALRKP